MAFKEEILIPKARIAVLIGQKGATKKMLEKLCKVKINVDSSEGLIAISGQDINSIFIAKDIVQAIGRGFSPDVAKELLKEGNVLDLINIEEYVR
ncbi:MAG: KH domain-containing protein, partial [Candidatus Nanoarchaeia archaeon]